MKSRYLIILAILGIVTLILSGCENFVPTSKDYEIKNIYVDPPDLAIQSYASERDDAKLCFDIKNNAKTTLVPKIELTYDELGKECLETSTEPKLSEIIPADEKHVCLDIRIKWEVSRSDSLTEACKNRKATIFISLQDITGVELNKGSTTIGII